MFRSTIVQQASKLRAPSRTISSFCTSSQATASTSSSYSTSSSSRTRLSPFASSSSRLIAQQSQKPIQWRSTAVLPRWNSTDASKSESQQPEVKDTTAKPQSEQDKAGAPEKSKVEQELEAKQKEVIELKVKTIKITFQTYALFFRILYYM